MPPSRRFALASKTYSSAELAIFDHPESMRRGAVVASKSTPRILAVVVSSFETAPVDAGCGRAARDGTGMMLRENRVVRHAAAYAAVVAVSAGCTHEEIAAACDRACLLDIAERYLEAVAEGDPALAPLSEDATFVENLMPGEPGAGIWASAAGAGSFRIYVPDPTAETVGIMAVIDRRTSEGVVPA